MSTATAPPASPRGSRRAALAAWSKRHPVLTELGILLAVWAVYSFARTAASDAVLPAQESAKRLLHYESLMGIDVEASTSTGLSQIPWLAWVTAAWYSSLHYIVTLTVLVTLFRRFPQHYRQLRRGLLTATMVALTFYVLMPTAPPRLMPKPNGWVDIVQQVFSVDSGVSDSAPRTGFAALTNQLAAFPSMHAGWALWSAIAIWVMTRRLWIRVAGVAYAIITAVAVVVTGNHWVIDVIAGWAIIVGAYALQRPWRHADEAVAVRPRGAKQLP